MTQLDKAKSGLRLAQILFEETESLERSEEEVNKAVIIADSIQGSSALDIQLRLYELQIQIQMEMKKFRLAKNTLRIASSIAAKQELHWWTYQFCLLKARMFFLVNDFAGSLTTLNQGATLASKRGDFDLKMAFWIVAGQYSLMLSNWDQANVYLQKLTPHMGLDEALGLAASTTTAPPLKESSSTVPPSMPQQPADMTQPMKSQQFLIEGIKVVDREFSVNDYASSTIYVRRNQRWFSLLMMSMLLHLADVLLLKFDLVSAEETILKATYWSKVCGMWDVFKWRISLSIGMTMQLGGRLEEALEWYGICLSHSEGNHKDPEGYEAKTLAIINTALVHCGERFFNLQKVKELQLEAKARHTSSMSTNLLCALHILDSWTKEGVIPARQHLQEALKLSSTLVNTQLRSLTLLLLGNVYLQTHDEQAEKMLIAGFMHAVKTGNQVIAAATGSCLKDLYLATSQGIKASQQTKQNIPILETVDKVFQLQPMAPLLSQE
ncbi:hypothetical protein BGX27_000475 [Mortierella sp. AM989]|nr:hypothetical protein BGX27_000475 [Mortierella sp. AM989]